jgi:hypothetical protein
MVGARRMVAVQPTMDPTWRGGPRHWLNLDHNKISAGGPNQVGGSTAFLMSAIGRKDAGT